MTSRQQGDPPVPQPETIYHRLGLEPTWFGLKPSQNPVWDSYSHGWDSNPAKTLGLEPTWLGLERSQNPAWDLNPRGWDTNPAKTLLGAQTQPKLCLGLQPEGGNRQSWTPS